MNGAELIAAERERQVKEKGWTAKHDDTQTGAQILACAVNIAREVLECDDSEANRSSNYWAADRANHVRLKYGPDHIRRLAIAGALIAAEIDRLHRAAKPEPPA